MLWFKNSGLIFVTILSFGTFCAGLAAMAAIPGAFSQDIKAGIGASVLALMGVAAGIVFAWVCRTWWALRWLKNYGLEAKGFVTRKDMPSGMETPYEFYMTYKFTDREGKEYQGCVTIPGPIGLPWLEGHEVNVLYDPDNPRRNIATERWLTIDE